MTTTPNDCIEITDHLKERLNNLEQLLISLNNRTFPELENRIISLEKYRTESKEYNKQIDFDNKEIDNYNETHKTLEYRITRLEEKLQ